MRRGRHARIPGAAPWPRRWPALPGRSLGASLALCLALLLAQTLGLLHGVAHPHAGHAPALQQLVGSASASATTPSVAQHEDGSALCRLVDHLAHADVLPAAPPVLAEAQAHDSLPTAAPAGIAARPTSPYEARGPPAIAPT